MLAKHGLEDNLDVIRVIQLAARRGIVPVDTQPVHVMETQHFALTYYRNVVLCMTGHHTGAAAKAGTA